jgi:hypothetical protein
MDFDVPPNSLSVNAMKKEVESIMKTTGLKFDWRLLRQNHGNESFAGVVVVRFKGKCKAQLWGNEEPLPEGSTVTLGTSMVRNGEVLPFSEVECDQVRKTVDYDPQSTCEQEKQTALGRAMGRVVAHELYHVLANTTAHTGRGLAKASQSFRDLVTGSLGFQAGESQAIRHGVLPSVPSFSFSK